MTVRTIRSKFRGTEGELVLKNICKTLKSISFTYTKLYVNLLLINNLPTQNKC